MKKLTSLFVVTSFLGGCATGSLQGRFSNDPTVLGPSGRNVIITVGTEKGEDISGTIFGKTVISAAENWLVARGYRLVKSPREAHSLVHFVPTQETKSIYVPGQTYSLPVYGGNSGTTTTVSNSYGQTLGTIQSSPSNPYAPSGYQTHYREGYSTEVTDRWFLVSVWQQKYGSAPSLISQGRVFPEYRNQEFYGDQLVLKQATTKLLSGTILGMGQRAPASVDTNDPGCWPRLGIKFSETKLEKGASIENFTAQSKAKASGLRQGDIVFKIGDLDWPNQKEMLRAKEGEVVQVKFFRNSKEMRLGVPAVTVCQGE